MMDEDGLNNRNWGYCESSPFRTNLGFQLMNSTMDRKYKTFQSGQNPSIHHGYGGMFGQRDCSVSNAPFMSFNWLNQHRDNKLFSMLSNPSSHIDIESRKRQYDAGLRAPKAKKERKRKDNDNPRMQRERSPMKKSIEVVSQGAFKKVLEKLASGCYDFSNQIDLKSHWARHGTNKFVTIR